MRLFAVSVLLVSAAFAQPYEKWLTEDVAYIVTDEETRAFKKLTTNQERDAFIADFWRRRDLTPATPVNEAKEEHYRRIAYANQRFASSIPGWKTDRGHVYILFGPPDVIESHPTETTDTYPYDAWLYRWMEGIGENVTIEFVDPTVTGEYRLVLDRTEKKLGMRSGPPLDPADLERWKKLQQRLAPKSN